MSRADIPGGLLCLALVIVTTACSGSTAGYPAEHARALHSWLWQDPPGPSDLVREALQNQKPVAFLQDSELRADSIDTLQSLVPSLYDAGTRRIALYFLDASDQKTAEDLVMGRGTNPEETAQSLVFQANSALGFAEYRDFLVYLRDFNTADPQQQPLLPLALGSNGTLSAEQLRKVLNLNQTEAAGGESPADSTPDSASADGAGEGAAFIWIRESDRLVLEQSMTPDTEALVLVHFGPRVSAGLYRHGGMIETETAQRALRFRNFSFYTAERPFSLWPDLYPPYADIVIRTSMPTRAVTPILDFILPENSRQAQDFFPDTRNFRSPRTLARKLNTLNRRRAQRYARALRQLN